VQGRNKSKEAIIIFVVANVSFWTACNRKNNPAMKKVNDEISVGNASEINGYSKHPTMRVIIFTAIAGNLR
jgi:hypothetical protein